MLNFNLIKISLLSKMRPSMKRVNPLIYYWPLVFSISMLSACEGQDKSREKVQVTKQPLPKVKTSPDLQIAEYIRHIFQDKNGNFWYGTNGYGAVHFDGKDVSYYSITEGFEGHQITGITEDQDENIWFATDKGVVKYAWENNTNGKKHFTNYTDYRHFSGQRFWSIFADSKNNIWGGATNGVFRYDGKKWTTFDLPFPEKVNGDFITKMTSMCITEDKAGNIWFSTMGHGVYKYNGMFFTQYSQKEGLADNSVDVILEDKKGQMWLGTRNGGLSRYDGSTFTNYTYQDSIGNNEVCSVYEDKKGNIWLSSEGYGVYRYDGKSFTNFSQEEGLGVRAVQTIFEDNEGVLWVGGGGGLYRLDGNSFVNVTKKGPWK